MWIIRATKRPTTFCRQALSVLILPVGVRNARPSFGSSSSSTLLSDKVRGLSNKTPAGKAPSTSTRVYADHHQNNNNHNNDDDDKSTISPHHHQQQQQQQQPQPRSRRSRGSSSKKFVDTESIPSYKEFVHRFTVLSLYRGFFKSIARMPHNQEDLKRQVRWEFKSLRGEANPFNVSRAVTEGRRRLQELQEFTGEVNKYESNSWMNTNDPDDPRGRVGNGWPWTK